MWAIVELGVGPKFELYKFGGVGLKREREYMWTIVTSAVYPLYVYMCKYMYCVR